LFIRPEKKDHFFVLGLATLETFKDKIEIFTRISLRKKPWSLLPLLRLALGARMKKIIRSFYERYCSHHGMDSPFLEWIGAIGFVAFPLFYMLRRTNSVLALLYDDFTLRVVASLLCLLLSLRKWWPAKLKPYYFGYSYLTIFYCLSFFLSFTMLQNQGQTASVVNVVIGAILITLLADWRNTIVLLLAGYLLSMAVFWGVHPSPKIPSEFVISAAGSILVILTGALSHIAEKQAELKHVRQYAALAGSIAHEIRNPLGQVKFTLDSIEHVLPTSRTHSGDQVIQAKQLHTLYKQLAQGQTAIQRGLQVISMILNEVSGKPIDPQTFEYLEAGKLTQKAVDEYSFETDGERNKVSVQVHSDFTFKVNETVYIFILFNLIKNALYYFKLQPTATIIITVDQSTVTVRDTGPGVPPELLARLFSAFATSGKTEGTGLGLAYCKRAMQAFGGDITCTSVMGEYTEFTLRFAVMTLSETKEHERKTWQNNIKGAVSKTIGRESLNEMLAGKTIVVADDNAQNRKIVQTYLKLLGINPIEAEHGMVVLELLEAGTQVDAILMDMQMPGLNGIQTTQTIRGHKKRQHIPIIALTGNDSDQHRQEALEAGMNGFISKPIELEVLREELLTVFAIMAVPLSTPQGALSYSESASVSLLAAEQSTFIPVSKKDPETPISTMSEETIRAAATTTADGVPLLDVERLENMRKISAVLLRETLPDYLEQMSQYLLQLEASMASKNLEQFHNTLHKLLNNAGESGSFALHQYLRHKVYAGLNNDRQWPCQENWLDTVKDLYAQTLVVMRKSYLV
jgi:signal transduction histidine kinase/CheY-like chemotaxis protein